ncbi:hypothetical protein BT96DRAFT_916987 [Gymnopus androsaceus JB14]|uniref:Uncharacterized protein n=1 Tax=Gymnopus androsaceus JB14 TaxID=1447944 RepID=A0A6A4I467_9AGAR|nr:hypothetical protein BT96DRAFT_916987 [Gymnopus androsaceus JB14]
MSETAVTPQIFSGASHFDITNSVLIASSTGPTLVSPIQSTPRATIAPLALETKEESSSLVESEIYARLLLPRKKGYPLWKPKADERLPEEYRRMGVRIGDIGILNDSGGFDYLFNACLPADHPLNAGRVPHDFVQLKGIDDSDTIGSAREYGPGSHVDSNPSHIHKTRFPLPLGQPRIPGVSREMGAGLSFRSSASKGALLILPEGGMRIDHQQYTRFYKYAADCARSWYIYINGPLARGAHNGSIYLVTGCDKARAWGVASFLDARPETVSLEFEEQPEYWFSTCNSATSLSDADDVFENQSGCVFLRGFKIAVQIPPFMRSLSIGSKVTYISHLDADELLPKPKSTTFSMPPASEWWFRRYMASGSSNTTHECSVDGSEIDLNFPARYQAYHPSDVINRWILSNNDEVDVAITHDDDWASVIQDDEEEMPDDQELIRRISKHFALAKSGRYAHVIRPQTNSLRLNSSGINSQTLKKSQSDTSMARLFRSTKKVIRRYASELHLHTSQIGGSQSTSPFRFGLGRSHSSSTSSLGNDSEIPRVVVWPPSPSNTVLTLRSWNRFCGLSSPPSSPLSPTSEYSMFDPSPPNSPYSSSRSTDSWFDYSAESSGSESVEMLEDDRPSHSSSSSPPKRIPRRKSTGDTLIPPLRINHEKSLIK